MNSPALQASSLGLGEQWEKVKKAYAAANRVLGDIVKVTDLKPDHRNAAPTRHWSAFSLFTSTFGPANLCSVCLKAVLLCALALPEMS